MFILLHLRDQEECNVYRSRGNTTAACKHVTSFFFSFFFFFFLNSIVLFHSGYSASRGALAGVGGGVCGRTLILKVSAGGGGCGEQADLRTLGTEQKLGPVSRRRDHAGAEPHTAGPLATGRNHSRQTGFQLQPCSLEGVGVSADPAAQGKLLPRRWVNHVQGALRSLQLFTLWPCDGKG